MLIVSYTRCGMHLSDCLVISELRECVRFPLPGCTKVTASASALPNPSSRTEGIAGSHRAPATALLGLPCEALWPAVAVSELCLRLWCAREAP